MSQMSLVRGERPDKVTDKITTSGKLQFLAVMPSCQDINGKHKPHLFVLIKVLLLSFS